MFEVSQILKMPIHTMTEGFLGRFSVASNGIYPQDTFLKKIQMVASSIFSLCAAIASIPFWVIGEVIEIGTKKGGGFFQEEVELNLSKVSLDPLKTKMVGTGLSTFQATSDIDFCKGTAVHDGLKNPELGLGQGVDILTKKGRDLTIAYLQKMNANTFRFSVEWADVIENGFGRYVAAASHFKQEGFSLVITLDHWIGNGKVDVFENPGDEGAFVEYAKNAYRALRPYVSHFLTFNEINVDAAQKYVMGDLPPKQKLNFWSAHKLVALKLQAHCKVYDALHEMEKNYIGKKSQGKLQVGLSHQAICMRSNSRWNFIARIAAFVMTYMFHESFMQRAEKMSDKFDFLGLQYYTRPLLGRRGWSPVDSIAEKNKYNPYAWMVDGMRYRFDPQGILPVLREVYSRIKCPIIVTETGSAGKISMQEDKALDSLENRKAKYNQIVIAAMGRAQDEGVELIGSLFWTLFDNLEWQHGYKEGTAFGIVARDLKTGEHRETKGFAVLQKAFLATIGEQKVIQAVI